MIKVLSLRKDGIEQPQFFELVFRYPNMGEGYDQTTLFGTEADVRDVLKNGEISSPEIEILFQNAHR